MAHPLVAAALAASTALSPAQPHVRPPCRTPQMLQFGRANAAGGEANRPDSVGYVDSAIYPIRVHYRKDSEATRAATVVLPAVENAWAIEVDQMGWPAPTPDAGLGGSDSLDVYMTNDETDGGAWTWGPAVDMVPGDDWYSVAAFIALDDTGAITDTDMPDFVAHEFNHTLQFTIDGHERTTFVWESTAEAMEELVVPTSNLYWYDIPDFQSLPFESLLFDGYRSEVTSYDSYSTYEYGGSISGLYLEQVYGNYDGTTLLQLWLDLAQGDASDEPDYVDALGMIGGDAAPTFEDVYLGLAEWRMFASTDDDGAHYKEGGEWNKHAMVATESTLSLSTIDGNTVSPADEPYDLGTSYWAITVDGDTTEPLHIEVTGDTDHEWGIVAAAWLDGQPARVVRAKADVGQVVSADLDLTGATKIMVGAADLGTSDLNAEGRHPREDFTMAFSRVASPDTGSGDTGGIDTDTGGGAPDEAGTTKVQGGCACATNGEGEGSGLGLAALALGAALSRRRRSAR